MQRATQSILSIVAALMFLVACGTPAHAQIPIPIPVGHQSGAKKKLSKEGPSFAATFNLSNFSFDAFAQGGWPLFVDYELEQPGHVSLTIKVEKAAPFTYQFKGSSVGRHEELITLPTHLGNETAVAVYSIKAVSDNTPHARLVSFTLHALAVGRAVGSSGLTQLLFSPREIKVIKGQPAASASYSFRAIRHFSGGARADIRLMSGGSSRRVDSKSFKRTIAPGETVSGTWNCKNGGSLSLGRHKLFVKAWFTLQDSGSWAVAQSQGFVMISP